MDFLTVPGSDLAQAPGRALGHAGYLIVGVSVNWCRKVTEQRMKTVWCTKYLAAGVSAAALVKPAGSGYY